ncbi:MAG TPA: DUF5693 family protein [Armatimonadota bacterium]|jgi:hypothetical protein
MRLVLWLMVAVGTLAAMKTAAARWHAEAANRRVAIILDWDEMRLLSEETNTPLPDVLKRFRAQGAEGVAIGEQTLGELEGFQRVEVLPPRIGGAAPSEMVTRLKFSDDALRDRVLTVIKNKWGQEVDRGRTVTVHASWTELYSLTVGLPDDVVAAVKAAGLQPVPRVTNFLAPDQFGVQWALDSAKAEGAGIVIFGGDQVLGYPSLVKQTAEALTSNGLLFGQVEFGKQKGEEELARALNGSVVRVHSINPTEMARTTESDAVDRFLRAAEERNIRALYVRALPGAPWPAVESNVQYVRKIAEALRSHGLVTGSPHPYLEYGGSAVERAMMGMGVGAATLLALLYAWPAVGGTLALVLLLALLDVVLPFSGSGSKLVALQGALLMPVLAFLVLRASLDRRMAETESVMANSLLRSVLRAAPAFLCASSLSALGAVFVVGLLSSRLGSMKIVEFSGIKAQQGGAIVLIAAMFYLDISSRGGLRAARERVRRRVAEIWAQPLVLGGFIIFVVAMAALAMLLARSGNDPGVGVSGAELQFRALLEKLMGVRPRTKEFLIGHPALLLGIALMSMRRVRWGLPLLIVGAIGQVSIVNTFCHLHTPLQVSVLRVFNGLWTGFIVALLIAWISDRFRAPKAAA